MHPSGFDTRAVASDEASTFLSIAHGKLINSVDERIRDVLEANSFLEKIQFMKDILKGWIKKGRLGGRVPVLTTTEDGSKPLEMFWEGSQERPQGGSGGKFVWVTVGAPGGDGEYRSISLKDKHEAEVDALRERLQMMGGKNS